MSRGAKHVELCVFRGQGLQVSKLHVLVWIWIVVSCKDTMIAALLGKNDVDEIDQAHVKITAALKEERKRQRQNEEETVRRRITDRTLALTTNAPDGMHPCLVSAPPVPCVTGSVFTEHVGPIPNNLSSQKHWPCSVHHEEAFARGDARPEQL